MSQIYPQSVVDRIRRLCAIHPMRDVAVIVGCNVSTITRMKKRGWVVGRMGRAPIPMPSDFVIQCNYMSIADLMKHYGRSKKIISLWASQVKRDFKPALPKHAFKKLPAPDDFAPRFRRDGAAKCAEHYGVALVTVYKWAREKGLPIRSRGRKKPAPVSMRGWVDRIAEQKRSQSGVAA